MAGGTTRELLWAKGPKSRVPADHSPGADSQQCAREPGGLSPLVSVADHTNQPGQ